MTSSTRTVTLDPAEAALRDAKMGYEWALRHGGPGDVGRAKRFLRDAKANLAAK